MPENPLSNENVAERLKLVRKAVAGTQTAFCKRIGIEVQRWNNFRTGACLVEERRHFAGAKDSRPYPGLVISRDSGWVATPTSR